MIVISSELPELIGLCDRIYTLNEGRLTGEVAREDAAQETLMHYMMKGSTSMTTSSTVDAASSAPAPPPKSGATRLRDGGTQELPAVRHGRRAGG